MYMLFYFVVCLKGMKGAQIVEMIDNEGRLDRPDKCPQAMYDLILKCWQRKYVSIS